MPSKKLFDEISSLRTEQNNPRSANIDEMEITELLELINDEDKHVPLAVRAEIPEIAKAVDIIIGAFRNGGRLFYIGAGTSGRLGIVDASECPPTFGSPPELVVGIIAGGQDAVFRSKEGAEDRESDGEEALRNKSLSSSDVVCGIAASGRTPFVIGGMKYAKSIGCKTIYLSTASKQQILSYNFDADVVISPDVGPEIISGSTRMKSGTAQKLVLNMLTTASFVQLGKTYGNVMVDLQLTNNKLRERAKKILMSFTNITYNEAENLLISAKGHVKTALLMKIGKIDYDDAQKFLNLADGKIKKALKMINRKVT